MIAGVFNLSQLYQRVLETIARLKASIIQLSQSSKIYIPNIYIYTYVAGNEIDIL